MQQPQFLLQTPKFHSRHICTVLSVCMEHHWLIQNQAKSFFISDNKTINMLLLCSNQKRKQEKSLPFGDSGCTAKREQTVLHRCMRCHRNPSAFCRQIHSCRKDHLRKNIASMFCHHLCISCLHGKKRLHRQCKICKLTQMETI